VDALTIPLADSRHFAPSVVGEIVEATGGYPYFLQFFGAICLAGGFPALDWTRVYRAVEPALLHELDLAFRRPFRGPAPPTDSGVGGDGAPKPGLIRLTTLRPVLASSVASPTSSFGG